MKILRLTLRQKPFEAFLLGIKKNEYRIPSKWILSRLIDSKTGKPKEYDIVLFTHGYGNDKPFIAVTYYGFSIAKKNYKVKYSNGLIVNVKKGNANIKTGSTYKKGNINEKQLF
jgi:basic membrane lipoprotein Med (substrate-binding protein (PBP1-ABC) superfamily)